MKISEVIESIKKYTKGTSPFNSQPINDEESRDQVLYGNIDKECTGIVTTCFASADVLKEAQRLGANLVIPHEALFWNHGDHTDWLSDNKVFQKKKELLDDADITVWRCHDYIHSGIPAGYHTYSDGIFYGFMKVMDWEKYCTGSAERPMNYEFPQEITASSLAEEIIEKTGLNGMRIVGDPDTPVKKLLIAEHVMGHRDNQKIEKIDAEDIDAILTLELIDYTVNEYIRDSAMLGRKRAILAMGHFNAEEPGMRYMATWLKELVKDIPVTFVQSGDVFSYITKE